MKKNALAQFAGFLCEEEGSDADNVKYCGYCKYHFSKLKHKERDKQKLKRPPDSCPALAPSVAATAAEKTYTSPSNNAVPGSLKRLEETTARFTTANFQEVSAHPLSGKDSSEVKGPEGKVKKFTGHNSVQKGRKSVSGKTPVTATSTNSPFQQGSLLGNPNSVKSQPSSLGQSPKEFLRFTDSELRSDSSILSQQASSSTRDVSKAESSPQDGLSSFGSLMGLPAISAGTSQPKNFENSHGDFNNTSLTSTVYKHPPPSGTEEAIVKDKKRRGSKRGKHGPGRPNISKMQENVSHMSTSSSSPASSVASAAGSISSTSIQKSPTLLRNGSLQSLSVSSSPVGAGVYTSSDVAAPLPTAVCSSSCSTPLSPSNASLQGVSHLQQAATSLLPGTAPVTTVASTTQASSSPASSVSVTSHVLGSHLNPSSTVTTLMSQSENSQADQELGDSSHALVGRSSSPRGSLSPCSSPVSSLQIRYDHSSSSGLENLPLVATSIDQFLERQWNEGQQFLLEQGTPSDILGILKSVHQLQNENRRLEEQIKILTAKKERLQLLNAQLSIPFPTLTSNPCPSPQVQAFSSHAVPSTDSLSNSKSPHLSASFLPEYSLPPATQDLTSSRQSTSSSSVLSTPPPTGQSPAQQESGVTGVQQVNGVTVGTINSGMQTATSTIPAVPGVGGLIGALPGNQLAINGIVGALNGVIQPPVTVTPNPSSLSHASVPPNVTLPLSTALNSNLPAKSSATGLSLLPDQQRQLFLHQQHPQHQHMQQLLNSHQISPEQHQALLYQLMQQQHHHQQPELQQLQIPGPAQININNLLANTQGQSLHTAPANPFLTIHGDSPTQKVIRLNEKIGSVVQEKS
ncbi:protein AF-10 [Protopterus annectens]|uniref:protein AF-10 n=1 Tax=Protopterus annectens TaxID=7888 RepID=UPI001CFC307A|nr:protein AF-10 [Protopterus annectens]